MSFAIEPLQPADLDAFITIWWDAFEPLPAKMLYPQVCPRGLTPDLIARKRWRISRRDNETSFCFCARDTATNEILGVTWWSLVNDAPNTREEIDAAFVKAREARYAGPQIEGMNLALYEVFVHKTFYLEAEIMAGRGPYVSFSVLATDPKHQRRGVGAVLLKQCLEKADSLGLPVFLESGVNGRPLYERHGFEVIRDFGFDPRDYGGRSDAPHWCMLRPAKRVD